MLKSFMLETARGFAPENEMAEKTRVVDLIDFVISRIYAKDGGLRSIGWMELAEEEKKQLFQLVGDESHFWEDLAELSANRQFLDLTLEKLNNAKNTLKDKVAVAKFLTEVAEAEFMEGQQKWFGVIEIIKQAIENPNNPYLLQVYLKSLVDEGDYNKFTHQPFTKESEDDSDERIFGFNDPKLAALNFSLPRSAEDKIRSEDPESDGFVVSYLSPDAIGIYSQKGDLIAWKTITPEVKKAIQNGEAESFQEPADAPIFEVNDVLEIKDRVPFEDEKNERPMFNLMESLPVRRRMENELGVNMSDFSLRAQYQLLKFAQTKNQAEFSRLKEFVALATDGNDKKNRVIAFLSLEHGMEMGENILSLGEWANQKDADALLSKYAEVVKESERAGEYLREKFGKGADDEPALIAITDNLLRRGRDLLAEYTQKNTERGGGEITEELGKCRADIWLFAGAFKHLSKEKKIGLKDVAGITLETKDSGQLTEEERREMRETFAGNRAEEGREFVETRLKTEFDPVVNEAGHKFYILKNNGAIISFARFDELKNGNLYCGFINTRSDIKGNFIGTAFLQTVFETEANDKNVEIKVRTNNRMLKHYQEDFGFEAVGEYVDLKTKRKYLKLVRRAPSAKIADSEARSALG